MYRYKGCSGGFYFSLVLLHLSAACCCCFLLLLGGSDVVCGLSSPPKLANTRWKIRLDVGPERGTWMPKRHPGWGESGARLFVEVSLYFSDEICHAEELFVGRGDTYVVDVVNEAYGGSSSTFVNERGEQEVKFTAGGWRVEKPPAKSGAEKGVLSFWLDCPSGAKRNDVEIFPGERIFFRTGFWDGPTGQLEEEYEEIQQLISDKEKLRQLQKQKDEEGGFNIFDFPKRVRDVEELEKLLVRKKYYEDQLPPAGTSEGKNGVKLSSKGSMVIKGKTTPGWLPASEYLIFGKFNPTAETQTTSKTTSN